MISSARAGEFRIALVHDRLDWHSRQLVKSFAATGATLIPSRLADCGFDSQKPGGLHLDGFDGLPDAVLVRLIAGGSFEAVTVRLGVLHALGQLGIPVVNPARAIEICTDKSATSFALERAGLATPASWTLQSREAALAVAERETKAGPLVLKPLFGSQGRGLRLISRAQDLPPAAEVAGVYYLQRFAGVDRGGYRDMRLLVSRGRVLAAMTRHSSHWITNIKQGATPALANSDGRTRELAVNAAACTGALIAGVDVIEDADGAPMVLEVNSMPGWSGLQQVTPFNIAKRLAADVLAVAHG